MYDNDNNFSFKMKDGCGKGKEYNFDGQLIYEGNFVDGEWNGEGKEYYNNEIIFEGEFLKGKRNGKGKEFYLYS